MYLLRLYFLWFKNHSDSIIVFSAVVVEAAGHDAGGRVDLLVGFAVDFFSVVIEHVGGCLVRH